MSSHAAEQQPFSTSNNSHHITSQSCSDESTCSDFESDDSFDDDDDWDSEGFDDDYNKEDNLGENQGNMTLLYR